MRFRSQSLERQLHLGLAVSLILLIAILWMAGSRFLQNMTEDFIASRLEHDAEALLGSLMLGPQMLKVRPARINQIYLQPFSGHYFAIRTGDGRETFSRSLWDYRLEFPQLAPGENARASLAGPDDQRLLVLSRGYRKQGIELTVSVAEDVTPIARERERFLVNFAAISVTALVLLLLLQHWVVRRTFRRLEPLREEIQRLAQSGGQHLSEEVPWEIRPLVREVNHLLRLLMQRNERSRNALGNLAHALKGPLNLLTRHFDRLTPRERDAGGREAWLQTERIRQLIERELKRARLAGAGTPSQRFDPHSDLEDLLNVLKQIYRDKGLRIELQAANGLKPFGDREDMLELLGNLLDNACKWAVNRVHCRLSGVTQLVIEIEDDGQGLADDDLQNLTKRGSRLDETVEGHGLGLAIVQDIVKLYDGKITFARSPGLKGLCVKVVLNRMLD